MTDELKKVQEEKINNDPQEEQFTPEQIQKAKDIVESWRDEAMQDLKDEFIKDYADMELLDKSHVVDYLKKRTEKYLDSIVNTTVSFPRMIKTNQEAIVSFEETLSKITEDDVAYEDIKASRMAAINQIKTYKADMENRKRLFNEYKTIITQIKELL
jgi:hypothetical protein